MLITGNFGKQKPVLTYVEPVEVLRMMLKNPKLRKAGAFAYGPEFLQKNQDAEPGKKFQIIQLHQSAWFHRAQREVGKRNMVLACVTNCDGVQVTKKHETIFFYLRLGNATAPTCFDPSCTHLIATIPDLEREPRMSDEIFARGKLRLFHLCIEKIFANFNEASKT